MIIRKAIYSDEPDMIRMGKAFFSETPLVKFSEFRPDALVNFIRAASMNPDTSVWVAEDKGKVVGAAAGVLYPLYFSGDLMAQELFWWVDPESRKTEAGRELYSALEDWAKENGAVALSMIAIENGKAGTIGKIYERKGFIATEHAYVRGL